MNEEKIQELINDNPIIQRLSKDAVGHAFNKVTSGFTCVGEKCWMHMKPKLRNSSSLL